MTILLEQKYSLYSTYTNNDIPIFTTIIIHASLVIATILIWFQSHFHLRQFRIDNDENSSRSYALL